MLLPDSTVMVRNRSQVRAVEDGVGSNEHTLQDFADGKAIDVDDLPVIQLSAEDDRRILRKLDWVRSFLSRV